MAGTKPKHGCDGTIEVWDWSTDPARFRRYTIAACPFCQPTDRPHFEFALCSLTDWNRCDPVPDAVHCGGCGMVGPWGKTELDAVEKWNRWNGTATEPLGDWQDAQPPPTGDDAITDNDLPF